MANLRNTTVNTTGFIIPASGAGNNRVSDTITSYTATGPATFSVPVGVTSVEVLVVAGGGGGGQNASGGYGGGGGAGGYRTLDNQILTLSTSYAVTVGAA